MRAWLPTSRLRDGWVGGGLHRHGRAFADGGGGKVGEARLSSDGVGSRTAPVAEGVLDHSLERRTAVSKSLLLTQLWISAVPGHLYLTFSCFGPRDDS